MEEIFGAEGLLDSDSFTTFKTTEWWYQDDTTLLAYLRGQDRHIIVRDQIKNARKTNYEGTTLLKGQRNSYLVYWEDFAEVIPVKNWELQIADDTAKNYLLAVYVAIITAPNAWCWVKGCPTISIKGRKEDGLKNKIESDPIKAIIKIGDDFFAVSRRHKFLLKGDPIDMAERLAPFLQETTG